MDSRIPGAHRAASAVALVAAAGVLLGGCFGPVFNCTPAPFAIGIRNLSSSAADVAVIVNSTNGTTVFHETFQVPAGGQSQTGVIAGDPGLYDVTAILDDGRRDSRRVTSGNCGYVEVVVTDAGVKVSETVP
ncbi:MAG TPA: hypothetical protein VGB42_06550 [Candidatus Thermoplasmatota archaeon]